MSWKTVLVPHDFSASANYAAALARDEAELHGARILLLHVIDLPHQLAGTKAVVSPDTGTPIPLKDYAVSSAESQIVDLADRLRRDGVDVATYVRIGSPIDEILRFADEEKVDIIIMGTHGRTGIQRLVAGSVAERVVRAAKMPVMTVRHPD
jgi:nucleotide-binding universal stress UspA family protein